MDHKGRIDLESEFLKEWEEEREQLNIDELAHLAWAGNEKDRLGTIWSMQNKDGGFGLNADYTSDIYDTLLVLIAENYLQEDAVMEQTALVQSEKISDKQEEQEEQEDTLQSVVEYMVNSQNIDGGFGYTTKDDSRPGLSAEAGIALVSLAPEEETSYQKLDAYCEKEFQADFSESSFYEQAELARYLYKRDIIKDADEVEQSLYSIQMKDGSIYGSVRDTIQYILLLEEIESYHSLKLDIKSMNCTADNYVLESGDMEIVTIASSIEYKTNQDVDVTLRCTVMQDGDIILTKDENCLLKKEDRSITAECNLEIRAEEGHAYQQVIELIYIDKDNKEKQGAKDTFDYNIHVTEEKDLVLNAEVKEDEDYSISLNWTDISTDDDRYEYRYFRKKEDGEWETRSVWNGEQVKVLNVYPNGADSLYTWMTLD